MAFTLPIFLLDVLLKARREEYVFETLSPALRLAFGSLAVIAVCLFAANAVSAFIYFQW